MTPSQPFDRLCKNCRFARPHRDGGVLNADAVCSHPSATLERYEPVMGGRTIVTLLCADVRSMDGVGESWCGPKARFFQPLGFA